MRKQLVKRSKTYIDINIMNDTEYSEFVIELLRYYTRQMHEVYNRTAKRGGNHAMSDEQREEAKQAIRALHLAQVQTIANFVSAEIRCEFIDGVMIITPQPELGEATH